MRDLTKDYRGNYQTTKVYDLEVERNASIAGDLALTGDLAITGGLEVTTDLAVTGNAEVTGTLDVTAVATFAGLVDAQAGLKVLASGKYTTAGSNATEVATIPLKGIEAGDIVIASIENDGVGDEVLLTSKVTNDDEITFVFASDPANDTVVNYIVLKA